jgi:hypothetical protein
MTIIYESSQQSSDFSSAQTQRQQVKQVLRQKINAALLSAQQLPPDACLQEISSKLSDIQLDCQQIQKTFIVVQEKITCNQHGLGGSDRDSATLFRGPSENASVAICVTQKGSLLHRNGDRWHLYKNAGDVHVFST